MIHTCTGPQPSPTTCWCGYCSGGHHIHWTGGLHPLTAAHDRHLLLLKVRLTCSKWDWHVCWVYHYRLYIIVLQSPTHHVASRLRSVTLQCTYRTLALQSWLFIYPFYFCIHSLLPGTFVALSMGRSSSTSALLSSVSTSSSSLLLTSPQSPGCVAWSLLSCTTSFSCSLPGQQLRQSTCTSSWWRWWGWTSTSEAIRGRLVSQHGVSDFANNYYNYNYGFIEDKSSPYGSCSGYNCPNFFGRTQILH